MRFDLQSHSTASDGSLTPAAVVAAAAGAGVQLLALTDHDTVEGVAEALAAGRQHGVGVVPAIELTCVDGEHEELHVCGYGVDHRSAPLLAALKRFRADREGRILAMAERMEELGWSVDRAELERRRAAGRPLGRPHLARGVLDHPANAQRLREEGIGGPGDLFPPYLVPGAAAYVPRTHPTVAEGIAALHAAGGIAVWAHPFWDLDDPAEVEAALRRFAAAGLDGVEAFYPGHSAAQTGLLCDLAEELGLLTTGSADFHGPEHDTFAAFATFALHGREPRLGPIAGYADRQPA